VSEPAREFVPDPRSAPDWWTARKLVEEPRPPTHKNGHGGPRKLWAVCEGCGTQRTLDAAILARGAHRDTPLGALALRCECGAAGHAKLTWVNPPIFADRGAAFPTPGQPRPGSYDFATGKKLGGWD
jgi:hypothetical protein